MATFVFVGAIVATPRDQFWAFGARAAILAVAAVVLRIPARLWWTRLSLELPFVAFALAMPFVGRPPFVHLGGVRLSEPELWGAWTIVAQGTLGVAASGVLVVAVPTVASACRWRWRHAGTEGRCPRICSTPATNRSHPRSHLVWGWRSVRRPRSSWPSPRSWRRDDRRGDERSRDE